MKLNKAPLLQYKELDEGQTVATKAGSTSAAPGVIETLSTGYEQLNRVLWIVALPILMDLLLWLGPQITSGAVVHSVVQRLTALYGGVSADGLDPSTVQQSQQLLGQVDHIAGSFNLLNLLVINLASLPSIMPTPQVGVPQLQLGTFGALLGVALALELAGTLIGVLYLGIIAQQIRDGRLSLALLARRVWRYWLSILGFFVLAIAVLFAISLIVGILVGVVAVVAPPVGSFLWALVTALAQIAGVLFLIYLFFLTDAIVVSEVGPILAAVSSARVVANNFWSSVGFIGLVYVISLGMQIIWTALAQNPYGTVIAIAANAYIASGLAAASMLFYKNRVVRLSAANGMLGRVSQVRGASREQ